MPHGPELAPAEVEHTIKPGTEGGACRKVLTDAEILEEISPDGLELVRLWVIRWP